MTQEPRKANPSRAIESQDGAMSSTASEGDEESKNPDPVILPTISAFFEEGDVSPAAFFRVLRKEKTLLFTSGDEARAMELMQRNDPNGERLWAIMCQAQHPDPVDRWIWRATQERLKLVLEEAFDPQERDSDVIFRSLRNSLSSRLASEDKEERQTSENWLRLGICWLVEKRSLRPWTIAQQLLPVFFRDERDAARYSRRAIKTGRPNEFKLAIAMAALGREAVNSANEARDAEKATAAGLRQRLIDAEASIAGLRADVAQLHQELQQKTDALKAVEAQLTSERQLWGHDLTETKAKQRALLGQRIGPLLSDAIDALEIEPPVPDIALQRLKSVISTINEANS